MVREPLTKERFPAVPVEPRGQPGGTMPMGTVLLSLRVAHKGAYLGLGQMGGFSLSWPPLALG